MIKRVLSIVLTFTIVFSLCCGNAFAAGAGASGGASTPGAGGGQQSGGIVIGNGSVSGNAGETIVVPINISGNTGTGITDGISGYNITVTYDPDYITLPESDFVTKGSFAFDQFMPNKDVNNPKFTVATAYVQEMYSDEPLNLTGDGALFSLKFIVNNSITTRESTDISVSVTNLYYTTEEGLIKNRAHSVRPVSVSINPDITIPVSFNIAADAKTYNSEAQPVVVTPSVEGIGYSVKYNGSTQAPTDAGTYEISIELNEDEKNKGYCISGSGIASYTINKKEIIITPDSNQSMRVGTSPEPKLTYKHTPLYGEDAIEGELSRVSGSAVGKYKILQGTLSVPSNYKITFIENVEFEIIDKNTQNVTLATLPQSVVYGDSGFSFAVVATDPNVANAPQYSSSNESVATIDASTGAVTIVGAGSTNLIISIAGNDDYADYTVSTPLTVNKKAVEIIATAGKKYIGQADDAEGVSIATWDVAEGSFVNESDRAKLTITRASGETVGKYNLIINAQELLNNYTFAFAGGTTPQFEILAKENQTITSVTIPENIKYGDRAFSIVAIADSGLDTFTYTTTDTEGKVITLDNGVITIVGVGTAKVIINQAGNYKYNAAPAVEKQIVINKREIEIEAIDLEASSVTFSNVVEGDDVSIDFTKISTKLNDDATELIVSNFILTGTDVQKYTLVNSESKNIAITSAGTITVPAEGATLGTVDKVAGAEDKVIVSSITITPGAEVELDFTNDGGETVNEVSLPKDSLSNAASLEITLSNTTMEFDATAIAAIAGLADTNVSFRAELLTPNEDLTSAQLNTYNSINSLVKTVYALSIGNTGINFNGGVASFMVNYTKPANSGTVKAAYINDSGVLDHTGISIAFVANDLYKLTVPHLSDYVIYAEPISQGNNGGGGGGPIGYTVKFDSNGGNDIKSITILKSAPIEEPEAPTRDGYEFGGWYTDEKLTQKYDFATVVKKSMTLYAKWIENAQGVHFTDVSENDWFYDSVMAAYERGLMVGMTDTTFAPKDNVTRAMFVTVLHRMSGDTQNTKDIAFADVLPNSYYASAVSWAKRNGIVSGISETEFGVDMHITREQMATMLYRYAEYKGMDTTIAVGMVGYADSSEISDYANSAVIWANQHGIMKGNSDNTFAPRNSAIRAELAAVFVRTMDILK